MIYRDASFFHLSWLYKKSSLALFLLLGLSIFTGFFLFFPSREFGESHVISQKNLKPKALSAFSGALWPVHEVGELIKIPGIENELVLLGPNGRIDSHQDEYFLRTSGNPSSQALNLGDQFFLDYENGLLALTREAKPLSLKLVDVTESSGIFEVSLSLDASKSSTYHIELQLAEDEEGVQDDAKAFTDGTALGPDQLIMEYGGEEFKTQKGAFRVVVDGKTLNLQQNDVYILKDSQWIKSSPHKETRGFPMMVVTETSPTEAELTFWDSRGVSHKKETLRSGAYYKNADLGIRINQIKKRTENRISCRIDSRRVHIKKGDWLVNQAHGWRVISGREEMERCIQGVAPGDLFVFDDIQKGPKGEILKGTLFDSSKTFMKPIWIPISDSK